MDWLHKKVIVKIDRPMCSKHPNHNIFYPINYGYIPNTLALDGEEIDAYVLGEFQPIDDFEGYVIAIIHRRDDVEFKLVVCQSKDKYTSDQIKALVEFQERFFDSYIEM